MKFKSQSPQSSGTKDVDVVEYCPFYQHFRSRATTRLQQMDPTTVLVGGH